ncbi:NAD(P) transhydrogenase subunit beta [Geodia barretti]|uniref:NAD(P) transhydrogenase subunit beta n=1 Tax=Geodia barretti TaxID=519541 RepID=A0AA35WY31_GEOBA|nr:NAD(P) transhydrogenase subunit beta [Geodia barretti]
MTIEASIVNLVYLIAAVLFIFGLKSLSHPRTAVRGNIMGASGMLIAVIITLFDQQIVRFELILVGLVIGASIGVVLATRVALTSMPQLVALFNGLGGAASMLVAGAALEQELFKGTDLGPAVHHSFRPLRPHWIGRHVLNILLGLVSVGLVVWLAIDPSSSVPFWALVAVAAVFGITLVVPIGGADMPVVISLLNSYSGLAAAATGFVLENNMLIIAGSLVGAAGLILTRIMSKAMNRSLTNVLFAGVGAVAASAAEADEVYGGKIKAAAADEIAMLMEDARRVVIVPGYGMAVAQAQFAVRDLTNLLDSKGVEVEFAIHPVAGRMPGHMNVLLAEVNIPYEKLREMDDINPSFEQTDMVLVIGANDVVNPVARDMDDPSNPIAGMPILNVDHARTVVVIKRSLSPGFAGIPNPLFAADNTLMFFSDAKQAALDLVSAIKEV